MADFIMSLVMSGFAWPLLGLLFGAVLPPLLWPKRRAAATLLFLAGFLFYSEPLAARGGMTYYLLRLLPDGGLRDSLMVTSTALRALLPFVAPTLLFVGVLAAVILLRTLLRRRKNATPPAP